MSIFKRETEQGDVGERERDDAAMTAGVGSSNSAVARAAAGGSDAARPTVSDEWLGNMASAVTNPPPSAPLPTRLADPPAAGSVQRKQSETTQREQPAADEAVETAAEGVRGNGSELPHREEIEASLGQDLGDVRAHVGGEAGDAADALGAEAYATGNDVAFKQEPDLHTAAHEAAHVVQQREGAVSFKGVGDSSDAHEQQADKVADAVVAGESAASLLAHRATSRDSAASGAVQRRPKDKSEYTASDSIRLMKLSLRAAAEDAKDGIAKLKKLMDEDVDLESGVGGAAGVFAFDMACISAASHLGNAFEASYAYGMKKAPSLKRVIRESDLAGYHTRHLLDIGLLIGYGGSAGYNMLEKYLNRHGRLMGPTGWKVPNTADRAAKWKAKRAERRGAKPSLSGGDNDALVTLNLKAARQNLSEGSVADGKKIESVVSMASPHLDLASSALRGMDKTGRQKHKSEIMETSNLIGVVAYHAARANVSKGAEVARLFKYEKAMMKLVGLRAPAPFRRTPADPAKTKTHGEAIKAKTDSGNPNTIHSAMASVRAAWKALLQEQIDGVEKVQAMASKDLPEKKPPWWHSAIEVGIKVAIIALTKRLAAGVASQLTKYIVGRAAGAGADMSEGTVALVKRIDMRRLVAVNEAIHGSVNNKVVEWMQGQAAKKAKDAIVLAKDNGSNAKTKLDLLREGFFEAQASMLNFDSMNMTTAFNNNEGDYIALEKQSPGAGFAALEGYRNALAAQALTAKALQINESLSTWVTFLAKMSVGAGKGGKGGTNLTARGEGGLETDDRSILGAREKFGEGILTLEMNWGNLSIKNATMRGVSDPIKGMLASRKLKELDIPIIAHGNVLGTGGAALSGELRLSYNEEGATGFMFHEQSKGGYPVSNFIRQLAAGTSGNRSVGGKRGGSMATSDDAHKAARRLFEVDLANTVIGSFS